MNKKQAKRANDNLENLFKNLQKEYSLEEIAESFIFPSFKTEEEQKEMEQKISEFIKNKKNEQNVKRI